MVPSTVRVSLLVGKGNPSPAPARLMTALESVNVTQQDTNSGGFGQGFQMVFRAQKTQVKDFDLVADPLLAPGSRVVISVTVNARPRVLMDGIITHHQFDPGGVQQDARLTITGNDLSAMLDVLELSMGYPALGHAAIVGVILAKYAMFGLTPIIIPPLKNFTSTPLQKIPYQSGTDLEYLNQLATANGYVFGIYPGPSPKMSLAYWGPSVRSKAAQALTRLTQPQRALTVNMGHATNVDTLAFTHNALQPQQVYGAVPLAGKPVPLPVLTLLNLTIPSLAKRPAITANQPFIKKRRLAYRGDNYAEAFSRAQGVTDQSSANAITAEGKLDSIRYGEVLTAPGIVGVRGVGASYDGNYFVERVSHEIQMGSYQQSFTLSREGTGTTIDKVVT